MYLHYLLIAQSVSVSRSTVGSSAMRTLCPENGVSGNYSGAVRFAGQFPESGLSRPYWHPRPVRLNFRIVRHPKGISRFRWQCAPGKPVTSRGRSSPLAKARVGLERAQTSFSGETVQTGDKGTVRARTLPGRLYLYFDCPRVGRAGFTALATRRTSSFVNTAKRKGCDSRK